MDIKVKLPSNVKKESAKLIAETIVNRLNELGMINEILKNSELTEKDALKLGRKAKKGRGAYLAKKYLSGS